MFEHILVAVDGSHKGGKSVPVAVDLATKYGSAVTIVHVREHGRYEGSDVDLGPGTQAEELVGAVLEQFRAAGVEARLITFNVSSVTGGSDALGDVVVQLEIEGRRVTGRGVSVDVVEASARAYLAAINRSLLVPAPTDPDVMP